MRITEPSEYAVLGLLAEQPRHGYALAHQFAPGAELRQVVRLEMSQLYAILKKLELLGLITAQSASGAAADEPAPDAPLPTDGEGLGERPPARGRRIYAPTPAGRAQLDTWLAEPVARPRDLRLTFLLKLFFALRRSHDDAIALLDRQEQTLNAFHQALVRQLPERHPSSAPTAALSETPGRSGRFSTLVLRARLRQTEAALAWLGDLRADLLEIA
jgi:DNA-binding PadR family transcriptional regulator